MPPDRRPGGRRPDGDRPRSFDPRRTGGGRPPRREFGDRPFEDRPFADRPPRERSFGDRPPRPRTAGGFPPRSGDEGGMSIRLDPRRLAVLRALASEAGVRPGELVTRWLEERLDASRAGGAGPAEPSEQPMGGSALAQLTARVDELAARLDAMAGGSPAAVAPRRRGRPPKNPDAAPATPSRRATRGAARKPRTRTASRRAAGRAGSDRIALHDEIAAVIGERGPMTAAELAVAIRERGRYAPPRSAKPLDAAGVNSRVSNRLYRGRFARSGGKIGLSES